MFTYPALYVSASSLSANSQKLYLKLIIGEYSLLIIASFMSLNLSKLPIYFIVYAFVFIASIFTLITRNWLKPEQDWYKGRALAESIKTSCWRYCMCAEPFGGADELGVTRAEFRNHLRAILDANRHIGGRTPPTNAASDQITDSMEAVRALSLDGRKAYYHKNRIHDQRHWYAAKAASNKASSKKWMIIAVSSYALATLLILTRISYPTFEFWPIEPIIVFASSIIGWTQIKKYNELASSYTLTAHEIGIIQSRVSEIQSEQEFSIFVNEAEQAFSREHTQWVARQQAQ